MVGQVLMQTQAVSPPTIQRMEYIAFRSVIRILKNSTRNVYTKRSVLISEAEMHVQI